MSKGSLEYVCQSCGAVFRQWQGKCADCGEWNALVESVQAMASKKSVGRTAWVVNEPTVIKKLAEIPFTQEVRVSSGFAELNRVLGGGFVPGSVILIGGSPGAGKSTLLLQVLATLADKMTCLYVTGEESLQQIAMRADRLGFAKQPLHLIAQTRVEAILQAADSLKPQLMVVDSIQTVFTDDVSSAPGSVSQVRESAAHFTRFAKITGTIVILVGHITKDGALAGPKVLEHMIDCSLMLEGDENSRYRTLRSHKNRFGALNELGVFAMLEAGLKEVKNPSALFLSGRSEDTSGTLVTVIWEGSRPLLIELQALVDESVGESPRRLSVGTDAQRLAMLLAVLHRHGKMPIYNQDVFINVAGGMKITETSADLAILLVIASSYQDKKIPANWLVFGEVGLNGEIRPVANGIERVQEAVKHGFTKAIIPKANAVKKIENIEVIAVTKLAEALEYL